MNSNKTVLSLVMFSPHVLILSRLIILLYSYNIQFLEKKSFCIRWMDMLKHFSSFSFFQFVHIYFHHLKKKKKEILIISIHFLYLTPSVINVFYQNQTDLTIFYILLLSIYQQKPTQSILPNDCYRLFTRLLLINQRNQYY